MRAVGSVRSVLPSRAPPDPARHLPVPFIPEVVGSRSVSFLAAGLRESPGMAGCGHYSGSPGGRRSGVPHPRGQGDVGNLYISGVFGQTSKQDIHINHYVMCLACDLLYPWRESSICIFRSQVMKTYKSQTIDLARNYFFNIKSF